MVAFARLKLEGHALAWWESDAAGRDLEYQPPMVDWEIFKDMIKA